MPKSPFLSALSNFMRVRRYSKRTISTYLHWIKAYIRFSRLRHPQGLADLEEQGINPQGWNTLKTDDDEYRLRLNYRYRMRYRVTDQKRLEIEVFYVGHRREAYR